MSKYLDSEIENEFSIELLDLDDQTFQGRFDYDQNKIENLAKDIKKYGQREPIGIRKSEKKKEKYQIIYGFQRIYAIISLNYTTISVQIYKNITERDCFELSIRDNEMHGDLTQSEKAIQCKTLKEKGWTIEELCDAFNNKKSAIYNWLKVSELDKITLGLIHHGYISVYHGLVLAKDDELSRRLEKLRYVIGHNWSVRDLKRYYTQKHSPLMMGHMDGWLSNCFKDLKWKSIDICKKCEYFVDYKDGMIYCKPDIKHPKIIQDFLFFSKSNVKKVMKNHIENHKEIKSFEMYYNLLRENREKLENILTQEEVNEFNSLILIKKE